MLSITLGCHSICPLLEQFQVTQPELSSLICSGHGGDAKKFHSNLAVLLIFPKKAIVGEMVFGLAMVWVHPYQAHLSTLDEVVKKFALLTTSSENLAHAFVWFNEDAQHVPLPKEGHLGIMIEGLPSRMVCGHICQLEVCLLLQLECQVVYPEGLKGSLEPVVTSLPESLAHGVNMLNKPTFLQVDLSQFTAGDCALKASAPHRTLTPISPTHLTMGHPPRTKGHISMAAEVQELLSCTALDTSSQALGSSTPKRPTSMALEAPSPSKAEDSSKPVATSSQASLCVAMPDITKPINQTLKVACTPTTLPAKIPGADTNALHGNVILLQVEMNRAMGNLLTTRSSLDAHQQKQVSDFEMALHQNNAEATEAIRKAKAHCRATIREVEAHHTTHIREAEANCASVIMEAEACCTADIRRAKSCCAEHAHSTQQLHAEGMQHLETEAMEEEGRDHLS